MRSNRTRASLFGIISCGLILSATFSVHAQTPTPSPTPKPAATPTLERQFFKNILRDQKAIWTSPFHLHGGDARWAAPLAIGTGALIATDRNTASAIAKFDDQLNASRVVSYAGSSYGAGAIAAAFYFVGRAGHDDRARETGLLSAEALIDSELAVSGLKAIMERRRPLAIHHRADFFKGGTSFPSGHAIHAWSVATVIANEYHDHRFVQIGAYGLASLVSVARYTGEKHFLSDVLIGSAMGYGIGRYVYHAHHRKSSDSGGGEEESHDRSHRWPMIVPQYDRHARDYGIGLAWSF